MFLLGPKSVVVDTDRGGQTNPPHHPSVPVSHTAWFLACDCALWLWACQGGWLGLVGWKEPGGHHLPALLSATDPLQPPLPPCAMGTRRKSWPLPSFGCEGWPGPSQHPQDPSPLFPAQGLITP